MAFHTVRRTVRDWIGTFTDCADSVSARFGTGAPRRGAAPCSQAPPAAAPCRVGPRLEQPRRVAACRIVVVGRLACRNRPVSARLGQSKQPRAASIASRTQRERRCRVASRRASRASRGRRPSQQRAARAAGEGFGDRGASFDHGTPSSAKMSQSWRSSESSSKDGRCAQGWRRGVLEVQAVRGRQFGGLACRSALLISSRMRRRVSSNLAGSVVVLTVSIGG